MSVIEIQDSMDLGGPIKLAPQVTDQRRYGTPMASSHPIGYLTLQEKMERHKKMIRLQLRDLKEKRKNKLIK